MEVVTSDMDFKAEEEFSRAGRDILDDGSSRCRGTEAGDGHAGMTKCSSVAGGRLMGWWKLMMS